MSTVGAERRGESLKPSSYAPAVSTRVRKTLGRHPNCRHSSLARRWIRGGPARCHPFRGRCGVPAVGGRTPAPLPVRVAFRGPLSRLLWASRADGQPGDDGGFVTVLAHGRHLLRAPPAHRHPPPGEADRRSRAAGDGRAHRPGCARHLLRLRRRHPALRVAVVARRPVGGGPLRAGPGHHLRPCDDGRRRAASSPSGS